MPAGQAHTTWFSELKLLLRNEWKTDYSIPEQFELVKRLNNKLSQIRKEGNMKPPMFWCSNCQERHRGKFIQVSITSTYFALEKEGLITHAEFLQLRREWSNYSKAESINVYGEKTQGTSKKSQPCISNHGE